MPKSTKPLDKRSAKLIDECVNASRLLGGLADVPATTAYRAKLAGWTLPQIEKEWGRLELERRRRFTANADTLVRSSGPKVISMYLRGVGLMVFLQRMDLQEVVLNGGVIPEPLTARVLEMVDAEGVTDEMLTPAKVAESVASMRAITCAVCVQPPERYYTDPEFDVDAIDDPHRLPRQFVMPGASCGPGQLPVYVPEMEVRGDGWRGLSRGDMRALVKAAIDNGPGALLSFRLRQESLVEVAHGGEGHDEPAEPAAGGDVPVGGTGPRSGRGRVRVVGRGEDG